MLISTSISNITAVGLSASASWPGGLAKISFTGTFDGAVFRVEHSINGGTSWSEAFPRNPSHDFVATSEERSDVIPAGLIRVRTLKAGASTDVTAVIRGRETNARWKDDKTLQVVDLGDTPGWRTVWFIDGALHGGPLNAE